MNQDSISSTGNSNAGNYAIKEHFDVLIGRICALPSKMIGFKPFCLYLATWLLMTGRIGEWVWFSALIAVLFGIVGLKAIAQLKT